MTPRSEHTPVHGRKPQDAIKLRWYGIGYEDCRAKHADLVAALDDAEFLLRKLSINWQEAGSMRESCARSAEDCRAALARAGSPATQVRAKGEGK